MTVIEIFTEIVHPPKCLPERAKSTSYRWRRRKICHPKGMKEDKAVDSHTKAHK